MKIPRLDPVARDLVLDPQSHPHPRSSGRRQGRKLKI